MSSTLLHKNVFSILSEINNTPEVHAYLDRLCGDAVALMHAYAVHEATQQSAVWGCMDFDVFESIMHEQHKMCSTPTPYRSGSVHTRDVPEVLQRGNIRERCYVLSNILSRRSHLWRFVVQCSDPSFMPHICRARAADLLGEHKEVCNGHLMRIHAEPTKQVCCILYCTAVVNLYFRDRHSVKIKKQNCSEMINFAPFSAFSVFNSD